MTCRIDFIFEIDLSAIREPIAFEKTGFFKGDGYSKNILGEKNRFTA
jgi:hypothetical protein